ncbi:plastocyanin/azurin family copper-binding protein [Planomicrobium okeanokoites]|uniref:plastocyanin/azurin family copper-binding protein n=1 Tax=Planomicrobium okeanokoites TaxID=244 RepID=UPI000A03080A|nr:plastocyanin/azurin family copper-binding protein [Planomicrobium okeanokoites]
MNKKLGLLLAGGALILSACGNDGNQASEEQNDIAEEMPVAEQEENTEEAASEEETDAVEETEEAEEEKAEEEAPAEEAPAATDAPEAMSGEASELLSEGDSTSFVFNQTGEFSIFCEPHPVMKMTVIVEEGAENSGEVALDIADYEYSEETITVAPGTTITWTNQDLAQHNVAFE